MMHQTVDVWTAKMSRTAELEQECPYRYDPELHIPTLDLVEVEPLLLSKKGVTLIYYWEIKTFYLNWTSESIAEQISSKTRKGIFKIVEGPDHYLLCQYGQKPILIINQEDGRIYTTREVWNTYEHVYIQHQAGILLDILQSRKLVINYKKRYFSFKKYGIRKNNGELYLPQSILEWKKTVL